MKRLTEKEQDYYRLKDYKDPCKAIDQLGSYEDIGFSPEELQQLVDRQKWHVVAEGDLPEDGKEVLAYIQHVYNSGNDNWRAYRIYEYCGRWIGIGNLCEVLAWRELPEPWEGAKG